VPQKLNADLATRRIPAPIATYRTVLGAGGCPSKSESQGRKDEVWPVAEAAAKDVTTPSAAIAAKSNRARLNWKRTRSPKTR